MNIKNISQNIANAAQNDAARKADEVRAQQAKNPSSASETTKATTQGDKVTLTATSQQVKSLEKKMEEARVDNSEKIKALKLAIKNGDYEVDTEAVAKKLIQTEFAFMQKSVQ